MGMIYKRGNVLWLKYYRNGKPFYESSHSDKETAAKKLLKLHEGQIEEGRFPGLRIERIRFEELAQDFINDYTLNGRKSLPKAKRSVEHLKAYFGDMKAVDMTTDWVESYIIQKRTKA